MLNHFKHWMEWRSYFMPFLYTHPKKVLFWGTQLETENPCSLYDCVTPTVSGLRPLSLSDALSCAHGPGLGGLELGHVPTGMFTSTRARTEAGRESKEKLPTQQSTGSSGARGEERRTCHRLVFSAGLGTSCDFFATLFKQTRPNCYFNRAQHQLTDLLL